MLQRARWIRNCFNIFSFFFCQVIFYFAFIYLYIIHLFLFLLLKFMFLEAFFFVLYSFGLQYSFLYFIYHFYFYFSFWFLFLFHTARDFRTPSCHCLTVVKNFSLYFPLCCMHLYLMPHKSASCGDCESKEYKELKEEWGDFAICSFARLPGKLNTQHSTCVTILTVD